MADPYVQFSEPPTEAEKAEQRKLLIAQRRQLFARVFSSGDGLQALHHILALGGVIDRAQVFPNDTGMMLAERAGCRRLALEILDLSGAGLTLEPYRAPLEDKAEPGPSGETGGQDGQGQNEA